MDMRRCSYVKEQTNKSWSTLKAADICAFASRRCDTQADHFCYGLSFGDGDQHMLEAISGSSVNHLFIGLYGDPNNTHNQTIQDKAHEIQRERSYRPLKVDFYRSDSAEI